MRADGRPLAPLLAAALALPGCAPRGCDAAGPTERPVVLTTSTAPTVTMNDDKAHGTLTATRFLGMGPLFPEQSALFELTYTNTTPAPRTVFALDNLFTPTLRVYDAGGKLLGQATNQDRHERRDVEKGEPVMRPPKTIALGPGEAKKLQLNLWKYVDTLPIGSYAFEATHQIDADHQVVSGRVPFEIAAAKVSACALGYESSSRFATVLAWIASAGGDPELLVRLSGNAHGVVQIGATPFGPVPKGARVAVSQLPPDMPTTWIGWVAVVSSGRWEIAAQSLTSIQWRSGPLPLPITDPLPVPRFPDRKHAVFLATGARDGRGALFGAVVHDGTGVATTWTVPLSIVPQHAAASFTSGGAIALLLAADDGSSGKIVRLDVDEAGAIVAPEQTVRATPNRVAALAVDMRPGAPQSFLVLESSRLANNRLVLVRLPLAGAAPPLVPFAPLAGWPVAPDTGSPLAAREIALEVGLDGAPLLALVDERGALHGGHLDAGGIAPLHAGAGAICPHVAAQPSGHTLSCFTDRGSLFHAGDHGGH